MLKIYLCLAMASATHNVPVELLYGIAKVESNLNPSAVSLDRHDYGLMQVRQKYSKLSKRDLLDACKNAKEAARILKQARALCVHKAGHGYLTCYNRGVTGAKRVKNASKDAYVRKVLTHARQAGLEERKR